MHKYGEPVGVHLKFQMGGTQVWGAVGVGGWRCWRGGHTKVASRLVCTSSFRCTARRCACGGGWCVWGGGGRGGTGWTVAANACQIGSGPSNPYSGSTHI
eukprot:203364-Chlamydomonas_euryale.AAC.1